MPNIDKCSIDASASSIAYSSRPISLLQDLDSEEEDDYDSDEEEAVAQARLEVFKNRIRAVAPAGSLPVTGPRMSVLAANKIVAMPIGHRGHKELKTRATIVRNVHKKHVGEGDVSIHDDDGDFLVPDQGNIMNSKPKVYIPFSKLAEEDDRSDEDEEEASPKKPGVPVFSPPKPKTDSPEPTKSPSAPSVSRKMSARPQSAPVTLASRRMSGASNGNQGPEVSGGGANCDGPVTSSSRSDEALVQIPLNSRASTAGRRTSMYAPNIQKTGEE